VDHDLSAYTTRACVQTEANLSPRLGPYLQVLQENIRKSGPHGDAEGQTRDQPRNALAVHLPLLCSQTQAVATFKDTRSILSDWTVAPSSRVREVLCMNWPRVVGR
jgi:hypothetical protein